ncbi:Hypothetical predicted protein [Octopus vulgaris]|uniref:Uncharacterized protein n=1 Tax=Octopus vulgaris TaxID=6645 RepID=A0AA36AGD3_OCTVU|nr:Hypothetical predicted protein [Octopus vulgaris]
MINTTTANTSTNASANTNISVNANTKKYHKTKSCSMGYSKLTENALCVTVSNIFHFTLFSTSSMVVYATNAAGKSDAMVSS